MARSLRAGNHEVHDERPLKQATANNDDCLELAAVGALVVSIERATLRLCHFREVGLAALATHPASQVSVYGTGYTGSAAAARTYQDPLGGYCEA